jgi:hypothetical protein
MRERTNIGSLDLCRKYNKAWSDDGTTTRAGKWAAACGGIDLKLPVRSMRAHRQARTKLVVGIVMVAVVVALALRWAWRASYGL